MTEYVFWLLVAAWAGFCVGRLWDGIKLFVARVREDPKDQ